MAFIDEVQKAAMVQINAEQQKSSSARRQTRMQKPKAVAAAGESYLSKITERNERTGNWLRCQPYTVKQAKEISMEMHSLANLFHLFSDFT